MPAVQPEFPISQETIDALCTPPILQEMRTAHNRVVVSTIGLAVCSGLATVLAIKRFL